MKKPEGWETVFPASAPEVFFMSKWSASERTMRTFWGDAMVGVSVMMSFCCYYVVENRCGKFVGCADGESRENAEEVVFWTIMFREHPRRKSL